VILVFRGQTVILDNGDNDVIDISDTGSVDDTLSVMEKDCEMDQDIQQTLWESDEYQRNVLLMSMGRKFRLSHITPESPHLLNVGFPKTKKNVVPPSPWGLRRPTPIHKYPPPGRGQIRKPEECPIAMDAHLMRKKMDEGEEYLQHVINVIRPTDPGVAALYQYHVSKILIWWIRDWPNLIPIGRLNNRMLELIHEFAREERKNDPSWYPLPSPSCE